MSDRSLVSGDRGFVGNFLVSLLKDQGHEVVGYSTRDGLDVRD